MADRDAAFHKVISWFLVVVGILIVVHNAHGVWVIAAHGELTTVEYISMAIRGAFGLGGGLLLVLGLRRLAVRHGD